MQNSRNPVGGLVSGTELAPQGAHSKLERIRIVLVRTTHPGNIGQAARAMKNMGLRNLVLVGQPPLPHPDATARATEAVDILDRAKIVPTLEAAVAGCVAAYGTTSRSRTIRWPVMDPPSAARSLLELGAHGPVALVFGAERTGLTNEELDLCQAGVAIPANPEYASLNLANAVQILGYELWRQAAGDSSPDHPLSDAPATLAELERFFVHLEEALIDIQFYDPENPRHLMRRLRRLFHRAMPDQNEINILRGILTAAQQQAQRTKAP